MFNNANVLVTGGAGFVASNLLLKLLELGANITATIHNKEPQIMDDKINYIHCDLTQAHDCHAACDHIDYVFMCAANTSGAGIMASTPMVHVTPNVLMNTNMLEAAYQAKVKKFLFISSNTVYPATEHPTQEHEMLNGEVFEKYYCVAWMKRFSEIMCRMISEKIPNPMQTIVLRPVNIYGPYDDFNWETSHMIPALVRKVAEQHNPLEVWGDGTDFKDYIYVDDFVAAMLLAMEKLDRFQPLNIGGDDPASVNDILNLLLKANNTLDTKLQYNKNKPQMIQKRLLDLNLAERLLGFRAKTPLATGLNQTLDWYKNITD